MAVPMAPETLLLSWGFHIISKEESDIYWLLQTGHVHCALSHCSKYAEWNMWLLSHGNTSTESPALKSSKQLPYQTKDVYYTFQFLGWTSYMFSLWSVISPSIFPVILHEVHVPSSQTCTARKEGLFWLNLVTSVSYLFCIIKYSEDPLPASHSKQWLDFLEH